MNTFECPENYNWPAFLTGLFVFTIFSCLMVKKIQIKPKRSQIVCFPLKCNKQKFFWSLTPILYIRDFSFYTLYILTYVPMGNRYQFWALAKAPTEPPTVYFNYGVFLCSCGAHNSIYVEFLAHQLFCHSSTYRGLKGKCLFPFLRKCEKFREISLCWRVFCELRLQIFFFAKKKVREESLFSQTFSRK
jgi:hypothetical protein